MDPSESPTAVMSPLKIGSMDLCAADSASAAMRRRLASSSPAIMTSKPSQIPMGSKAISAQDIWT
ncbi:hypothetical protein QJS10_CPB11g02127 [Acorus calamus]|uniref:Uncharacterized protein n=1 Tax=Acorus calamus TaxID=4465 RepID=A0AAV9DUN5_ACOCL|nr:hypothetical protein QJS10_CPB11g02127 [Acorus calamus]